MFSLGPSTFSTTPQFKYHYRFSAAATPSAAPLGQRRCRYFEPMHGILSAPHTGNHQRRAGSNRSPSSLSSLPLPPAPPHSKKSVRRALGCCQTRSSMAPKQNRIAECVLGDRRWVVPCSAPPDSPFTRLFLLRLPEPCIVSDVVLDTRLPCAIAHVDACCPHTDESQGGAAQRVLPQLLERRGVTVLQGGAAPRWRTPLASNSWPLLLFFFCTCTATSP